ncbi:SAM-dependent methyltransferase [Streptomyces cavernicola]|uniref:Class I SAM-dependent methyltransferase n=1 Tax=Streptomyces cavernicola TaxID=3043613 RepID=A0ABT6SB79_9ACTN|nr:class I SAM-dependent methyltransferase [Streptomyces sp. B-S-A6]MDI3404561.1 class I SAM-dependent methyltransferase [Streptomyces sp. B-S-A6]
MDRLRQKLSTIAHGDHHIAAPLHESTVRHLLDLALPHGDERVLDLGCGEGAWLLRAAAERPGVRADGVDVSDSALALGRERIAAAGLADRVALHEEDAASYSAPHQYDVVLCVGATHAFGGLLPTLEAARKHLAPGGTLIVGDGFWEQAPGPETLQVGFREDEFMSLPNTVDQVLLDQWIPVHGHISSLAEWDEYEWAWTGTLSRWALDNAADPDSAEALRTAAQHREEWLRGYRGTLGFLTMLLRQQARSEPQHTLFRH